MAEVDKCTADAAQWCLERLDVWFTAFEGEFYYGSRFPLSSPIFTDLSAWVRHVLRWLDDRECRFVAREIQRLMDEQT